LYIDFETGQIDNGHDGCVCRYRRLLIDEQVSHDAADRRLDSQVANLALHVLYPQALPV